MFTSVQLALETNSYGHAYIGHDVISVSMEGIIIATALDRLKRSTESSEVLNGPKNHLLRELNEICSECKHDGWAGDGSRRIQGRTIDIAEKFIAAFPYGMRTPELAPAPDGSISFDWIISTQKVLTAFVGPSLEIPFAWIDLDQSGHGVASFDSFNFPSKLQEKIINLTQ